jgi:hypothetical protein
MPEKLISAMEPVIQAINNKFANLTIATAVAVSGKAAELSENTRLKGLAEIQVTEIFQHELSAAAVATLIGSAYIILQFAIAIAKGVIWYRKNKSGKNLDQ